MELLLAIRGGDHVEQEAYSHRFDERGGTIGRSPRNDWMLVDPDRYVSERHARIEFDRGRFILIDLSTNGTYLNDARRRIARNESVALESGDQLSMGNLLIDVTVLGARRGGRNRPGQDDDHRAPRGSTIPRRPAAGHGREREDRTSVRGERRETPDPPIPDEWRDLVAGFFEPRPDDDAGTARGNRPTRSPRRGSKPDASTRALLNELGIAEFADDLDPEALGRDVGRILRMVAEGLMDALGTRAQIKNKFRIEQTQMRAAGNNPLKSSANLETALRRLFVDEGDGTYLRGEPAFREAFDDLRTHELAVLSAVHASIEAVIASFDPRPLKDKLRRIAPVSAATPVLNNAKCWSLYEDHYQDVAAQLRDDARLGFLKEFAKAYEAATRQMRAESGGGENDD